MKILYISSSRLPSRAANSIHVMKMCQAWADAGHQVVLLAQHEKKHYEKGVEDIHGFYGVKDNFRIIRLPSFSSNLFLAHLYGVLCGVYAKLFGPDLVYGRDASGLYWSIMAGFPGVLEIHNPDTLKGYYPRKLVAADRLKYLVVISEKMKDLVLAGGLSNGKHIMVAHDGADAEIENSADSTNVIERPPLAKGLAVGYTGHLYPGKGGEVIVEIAEKLPAAGFHLFGGEQKDIDRLARIAPENVYFHGFIPQADVPAVQRMMDILILPAQHKVAASGYGASGSEISIGAFMSPLKLFEYMRAGRPIIASDLPVIREVLEHGRNALLCPPDEFERWVESILLLKNSAQTAEKLARNAKKDFLEKYTWQKRSEQVLGGLHGNPFGADDTRHP